MEVASGKKWLLISMGQSNRDIKYRALSFRFRTCYLYKWKTTNILEQHVVPPEISVGNQTFLVSVKKKKKVFFTLINESWQRSQT